MREKQTGSRRGQCPHGNRFDTFAQVAEGSTRDLAALRGGVLYTRVRVKLRKGGEEGEVVLEINEGDQGPEANVIATRCSFVSTVTEGMPLAIPISLIFVDELPDWDWAALTPEQVALRTLLKEACERENGGAQLIGEPSKSRKGAIELHVSHLKTKPRHWVGGNKFTVTDETGVAHFERREILNGVRALTLLGADFDHPLSVLLEAHREVTIEACQIFDPHFTTIQIGDLRTLKEAQRMVVQYLALRLPQMGYEPKAKKTNVR